MSPKSKVAGMKVKSVRSKSKSRSFPMMFKEVLTQLFRTPATQLYPVVQPEIPEGFRGRQAFNIDLCASCGLCAKDCPAKAIEMVQVEGYDAKKKKPMFLLDRCIFCYQCADSCPKGAIERTAFFEMAAIVKGDMVVKPGPVVQGGAE